MRVREKILLDKDALVKYGAINIVIFGDSISHGAINGYQDYESVYWNRLRQKLNKFRDYIPVNMINSAIGGTTAKQSLKRLDSQVLKYEPDLVIVCFGLNDANGTLDDYTYALGEIFKRCKASGTEVIFMTPNMLNTRVAEDTSRGLVEYAKKTCEIQNSGKMDEFMSAAVALACEMGVTVCDCYSKWKTLSATQDITELLANRINHPTPEMHELFAEELYRVIMGDGENTAKNESTMFVG